MTAITDTHARIIAPPVIQAAWNGIRVNVLDMVRTECDDLIVRIQDRSGKPFTNGARSVTLALQANTLEHITPLFTAHGYRWTVTKGMMNYSLHRWDGVVPRFICTSGLPRFEMALRHLAEKAEKAAGKPGWFEFLYAWMENKEE